MLEHRVVPSIPTIFPLTNRGVGFGELTFPLNRPLVEDSSEQSIT